MFVSGLMFDCHRERIVDGNLVLAVGTGVAFGSGASTARSGLIRSISPSGLVRSWPLPCGNSRRPASLFVWPSVVLLMLPTKSGLLLLLPPPSPSAQYR